MPKPYRATLHWLYLCYLLDIRYIHGLFVYIYIYNSIMYSWLQRMPCTLNNHREAQCLWREFWCVFFICKILFAIFPRYFVYDLLYQHVALFDTSGIPPGGWIFLHEWHVAGALNQEMSKCAEAGLGKKGDVFFLITPKKEAVKNSRIRKFLHTFFYARHRPTAFIWSRNFSLDILCISQGRLCSFIRLDVDIPVQAVPLKMIEIPDGWFSNTFCHCKDDDLVPWRWSKKVIGNICQSFCNPGYNFPPFC